MERGKARLESVAEDSAASGREELAEALERIRDYRAAIRTRKTGAHRAALRLLRDNPTAKARDFGEALETLRNLIRK